MLEQKPANRSKFLLAEYDLVKAHATKIAKDLKAADSEAAILAALDKIAIKKVERRSVGQLALQPGEERRRTSSHYTPRSLSQPIVRRTLEPLLAAMDPDGRPGSEEILRLKICDPAMGSGAFLVEACRFLGDHVVAAWEREGQTQLIASAKEDVVNHARRLVAQKCLYGVDKNPFAVHLAKLSLWLVTLAKEEPFTFVDHCLRHGDSLVGLSFAQIKSFHWKPEGQMDLIEKTLSDCIEESLSLRRQILDMAGESGPGITREKEQLLWDANDAQERARIIGDLVVGGFFACKKDKDRKAERVRRLDLVRTWLADGGGVPDEIAEMSAAIRRELSVFHWWLEFPEVFHAERSDPLEDNIVNRSALMDAFIGNPPFLGGRRVSGTIGVHYSDWLEFTHSTSKNADLCVHFFRRSNVLLGAHGTIGLIGTNTMYQGDTREAGLQPLLRNGLVLYDATKSTRWPGAAAVAVSIIHLAKGMVARHHGRPRLDGECVDIINSRLRPHPERPNLRPLSANTNMAFQGSIVLGMGFTLTPKEREELVQTNPRNVECIFPYLGGADVSTHPKQVFERYVINFGEMTLEESEQWPDLMAIVRERVKPERDRAKREADRKHWWQHWRTRPALYQSLKPLDRCLVALFATKHITFSFQETNRVFANTLVVFPVEDYAFFAVLQSRLHSIWAWLLCSTYPSKSAEDGIAGIRYTSSDCFDTFPFPTKEAMEKEGLLSAMGEAIHTRRSVLMANCDHGLTALYNSLGDANATGTNTHELRQLHVALDRAVLAAYGWQDLEPPAFTTPTTDDERAIKEAFDDEIIDRLFALNADRAAKERALGLTGKKGKSKASKKPRKKSSKSSTKKPSVQLKLGES